MQFILETKLKLEKRKQKFITEAEKVHSGKYDYSKVEYIRAREKVTIICPIHGDFDQTPDNHRAGHGCKRCGQLKVGKDNAYSLEDFIKRARKTHGNRYDYSKVKYLNDRTKVEIVCRQHGSFWQAPIHHYKYNCNKCGNISRKRKKPTAVVTKEEFIHRAKEVHGETYDYSRVNYVKTHKKVEVVCKKHGGFKVTPNKHMLGSGCPNCSGSSGEDQIARWLNDNNIIFESQKYFDTCRSDSQSLLYFDFYLPTGS